MKGTGYLIAVVAALTFLVAYALAGDVIIALVAALIVSFLSWGPIAARRERQRKNELAQGIYDRIDEVGDESPIGPFFVYLRSFTSDAATTESWQLTRPDGSTYATQSGSPKVVLETVLERFGPLIELGGRHHLSLGQVTVADENWWPAAEKLIIHGTAIFVSPGVTESVQREAELILGNPKLRRRTFLIMEPTHDTMLSAAYQSDRNAAIDRSERWAKVREFYRHHGVSLPSYRKEGAIISLSTPMRWLPFTGIRRRQLQDLLQSLNVDLSKPGSYDIDQDEACPCKSGKQFGRCHYRG